MEERLGRRDAIFLIIASKVGKRVPKSSCLLLVICPVLSIRVLEP